MGQLPYLGTGFSAVAVHRTGRRHLAVLMIEFVTIDQHIEEGRHALRTGRWEEARAAFEASLAKGETPEALDGMGEALWWLCEARPSARYRERAYVRFRQAGDFLSDDSSTSARFTSRPRRLLRCSWRLTSRAVRWTRPPR